MSESDPNGEATLEFLTAQLVQQAKRDGALVRGLDTITHVSTTDCVPAGSTSVSSLGGRDRPELANVVLVAPRSKSNTRRGIGAIAGAEVGDATQPRLLVVRLEFRDGVRPHEFVIHESDMPFSVTPSSFFAICRLAYSRAVRETNQKK